MFNILCCIIVSQNLTIVNVFMSFICFLKWCTGNWTETITKFKELFFYNKSI